MMNGREGRRAITRRGFMALSAASLAGLVASACGGGELPSPAATSAARPTTAAQPTTGAQPTAVAPAAAATTAAPTAGAQPPSAAPTAFKEAPQLTEQVRAGRLPAVDQRLPKTPLVLKPVERVGRYGGQWRTALIGGQDTAWMTRTIGNEHLVRWDPEWKQVIPNVAESFQVSPDAKEFTFKLREGLKWSDGAPFTADDLTFWWEDYTLNKDLNPGGVPVWMRSGDKAGTVEKVNQYTVKFRFEQPNGLFLQNLATPEGNGPTRYPRHYLQQFHQKYNTTNLDQLIKENNVEGWVRLFQTMGAGIPGTPYDALWQNKDLPVLHAWILTSPYGGSTTRAVGERNPYYFKIDPEGNQLPYLDRVTYDVLQDREPLVLKIVNGEIDMHNRHVNTFSNKAVFTDNQQRGGYTFFEEVPSSMNQVVITLNLTHKDPVKRQIFANKDFRAGLSHAINRQEIIDVVYVSQGEPWQAGPRRESAWFNERLAKQYTEYSVQKANEFLDKTGFSRKDSSGIRLGPDGKPISFAVEVSTSLGEWTDVMNLVQTHWKAVGIDMQVKAEDRSLLYTRKNANDHDAVVWSGDGGLRDGVLDPRYFFPFSTESNFAQAWSVWYNPGGNPRVAPEEPPAETKRQIELYRQLQATGDEARQIELFKQVLEIAADQFYCMGIALPPNGYGIVKNNFKNVPKSIFGAWLWPSPGPSNPPQYFIEGR